MGRTEFEGLWPFVMAPCNGYHFGDVCSESKKTGPRVSCPERGNFLRRRNRLWRYGYFRTGKRRDHIFRGKRISQWLRLTNLCRGHRGSNGDWVAPGPDRIRIGRYYPCDFRYRCRDLGTHGAEGGQTAAALSLRRLERDWSEGGSLTSQGRGRPAQTGDVTWSHRSFNSSDTWNKEGGDFGSISATATVSGTGSAAWSSSQMAADVQMWLDDPNTNFGWILLGSESTEGSAKGFASSEGPSSFRPKLTIEFSPVPPAPPEIAEHPVSQSATLGSAVTFSVQTAGEVDAFGWFKDGLALAGETAPELVLLDLTLADAGTYFVEVSNAGGTSTSEVALLDVLPDPPEIVEHPVSRSVTVGSEVRFSVQTAGEVDTIQWFKDDSGLAGETAAELVLLEVTLADAGTYFVEVSNTGGTASSEVALLEVLPSMEVPSIFEGAVDLGGGWRFVAWFGTWNESLLPWIFHLEHGWQFVSECAACEGAWFFDLALGWLFTSPDLYPNYFSVERNEWIFYIRDTTDPRQFVSFGAGEFFQAEVSGL